MEITDWVAIEEGNDWGAIFYTFAGERLNKYGTNATDSALVLTKGQMLNVQFRDGTERVVHLDSQSTTTSVSDHGRQYPVHQERFGFNMQYRGSLVWIPLQEVRVRKDSLKRKGRR
jgi:hypothetical protein